MALNDPYATYADYLARFSDKPGRDQGKVTRYLGSCSRWIEDEFGIFYGKDAAVVARFFRAKYYDRLDLDYEGPCPGIATTVGLLIQVDTTGNGDFGTAWATTDYDLEPRQAANEPVHLPWNTIRRRPNGTQSFIINRDVKVTAEYGYPNGVPSTVRDGCVELVGILLGDSPLSTRQFTDFGSVGASTEARGIVRGFINPRRKRVTF